LATPVHCVRDQNVVRGRSARTGDHVDVAKRRTNICWLSNKVSLMVRGTTGTTMYGKFNIDCQLTDGITISIDSVNVLCMRFGNNKRGSPPPTFLF